MTSRHTRENLFVSRNLQVATVLDQLHKFLGPELKAVTGESAGIDEIMDRVEGLALPLNKVIPKTTISIDKGKEDAGLALS